MKYSTSVPTARCQSTIPTRRSKWEWRLSPGRPNAASSSAARALGVSVAACKIRGIRAATVHDTYTAHQGVEHDGVNVLCLGGRVVGSELAAEIVAAFLGATISMEERHVRRRAKVDEIERTGGLE